MIRKRKRHAGQGVPLCKILLLFHQNGGKTAGLQQGAQVIRRRGKEKMSRFAKSRCYFIRTAERRQASSRERRSSGGAERKKCLVLQNPAAISSERRKGGRPPAGSAGHPAAARKGQGACRKSDGKRTPSHSAVPVSQSGGNPLHRARPPEADGRRPHSVRESDAFFR